MPNDLSSLLQDVQAFFHEQRGLDEPGASPNALPLIEVACLGNPERTIQAELHVYLRMRNWNAVCEMGYRHAVGVRGSADIAVFDGFSDTKHLLCVVELKHYSGNQGPAAMLIAGLDSDSRLPRPAVPMMQVGLYTVVESIQPPLPPQYHQGIYRFLNTYCRGALPPQFAAGQTLSDWANEVDTWLEPFKPVVGRTPAASFCDDNGSHVRGHLEYLIGIRLPLPIPLALARAN